MSFPNLPAGMGWPFVDATTGEFQSSAVNAHLHAKLGRFVSAAPFGASAANPDNLSALQAAVDAAGPYGVVFLPNQRDAFGQVDPYEISGELVISHPQVTIVGDRSEYGPAIQRTTPGVILRSTSFSTRLQGVTFIGDGQAGAAEVDGVVFDRSDGSGDADLANLDGWVVDCGFIYLRKCVSAVGRNVDVLDSLFSSSVRGLVVDIYESEAARGFRVKNNRFHSMGQNIVTDTDGEGSWCVDIRTPFAYGNEITGNHVDGIGRNFYRGPISSTMINGNHMYKMDGVGIYLIDPTTAVYSTSLNNYGTGSEICGNTFQGYWVGSRTSGDLAAALSLPDSFIVTEALVQNLLIAGNSIAETRKHGIHIDEASGVTITGNKVFHPGRYSNRDGANLYDGIYVAGGADVLIVANDVIGTAHRYGVNVASTNTRVRGGLLKGHLTGSVNGAADTDLDGFYTGFESAWNRNASGVAGTMGFRGYKASGSGNKTLFAEIQFSTQSDTGGAEQCHTLIRNMLNGTLTTVATFQNNGTLTMWTAPSPTTSSGWLNARDFQARQMKLVPVASTTPANNSFFVDTADNVLKFKDNSGTVKIVNLT